MYSLVKIWQALSKEGGGAGKGLQGLTLSEFEKASTIIETCFGLSDCEKALTGAMSKGIFLKSFAKLTCDC